MGDSVTAIAQSFALTQAQATQQALQTEMLRQNAAADQGVLDLLQQGAEQMKAILPAGQGGTVDVTA